MIATVFQVRSIIQKSFKAALDENDILISPAAPSAAYKIGMPSKISCLSILLYTTFMIIVLLTGEKVKDPLAMYAGDIMTVSISAAHLLSSFQYIYIVSLLRLNNLYLFHALDRSMLT